MKKMTKNNGGLVLLQTLGIRLKNSRFLGLAAEMAFWLFMSLLPVAAVAGLITAKFASSSWSSTALLLGALPGTARTLISDELDRVSAWNGGQVGVGAAIMFIWLASSGVHAIFDGIELESAAAPRSWWKKRLLAVGACVALSVGLALVALLGSGIGWLWKFVGGSAIFRALEIESSVLGKIVRLLLGAGVSYGLINGLYWIALPPEERRVTPILKGALLAMTLQTILGFGYGFYITKAGNGGAYQAGLASIGVTLIALYLFCLALLVGINLTRVLVEAEPARPLTARPDRAAPRARRSPYAARQSVA